MTEAEGRLIGQLDRIEELLGRIAAALEEKRKPRALKTGSEVLVTPGSTVWAAYHEAYSFRYDVEPVRNAKTNALCAQLVIRLGADAPDVAAFYVAKHNDRLYLNARHALELLVRDAEKIRTDWKRGLALTSKDATNEESLSVARNQMEQIARGKL